MDVSSGIRRQIVAAAVAVDKPRKTKMRALFSEPVRRDDVTPTVRSLKAPVIPVTTESRIDKAPKKGHVRSGLAFSETVRSDVRKREPPPTCKERPEPGPKRPGGGASRAFVPWCSKRS